MSRSSDCLYRTVVQGGALRAVFAVTTDIVREAQKRHSLDPLATIAFGRGISCSALLSSTLKDSQESLHLSFNGEGLLKSVVAETTGIGDCRGYVTVPQLVLVVEREENLPQTVGEALGPYGVLTVRRTSKSGRQPYTGLCPFKNGEIAEDLARYLLESEQISSAVAAGVHLGPQGEILGSGGLLIQQLPGVPSSTTDIAEIEKQFFSGKPLSQRISSGETPEMILGGILWNHSFTMLESRSLQFRCSCSRAKMKSVFVALGEQEIRNIETEIGKIEATCKYCGACELFKMSEFNWDR